MKTKTNEPQRYAIHSDNSGHDYFILVDIDMTDLFYEWVAATDGDKETDLDFEKYRIDGTFTFTDPRCE
jgi:hypothetical protein